MKTPLLRQIKPVPQATIAPVHQAIASSGVAPVLAVQPSSPPIQAKPAFLGLSRELNNLPQASSRLSVGDGRKLPAMVQRKMEAVFNADFSDVRIHEGTAPETIGAIAYTQGVDIHFAPKKYAPHSQAGQQLLGHELAHVIQQRSGRVAAASRVNTDSHLEAEADAMGAKVVNATHHADMSEAKTDLPTPMPTTCVPIQLKKKFKDKNIDRTGRNVDNISGGAVNTVDLVTYKQPIGSQSRTGFFKADVTDGGEIGYSAKDIGIDQADPQLANRAVASSRMAGMLRDGQGTGPGSVVAETIFARHNHEEGTVSEQASGKSLKEGIAVRETDPTLVQGMTGKNYNDPQQRDLYFVGGFGKIYRPGNSQKKIHITQKQNPQGPDEYEDANGFYAENSHDYYHQFDFTNPLVQKGLMDLQLMDAITGQVDRHGGNIFIDPQTGQVTGIDNDAAFGSQNSADPNGLRKTQFGVMSTSHNKGLPPLVDYDSAQMVLKLDPKAVRQELKTLLSPQEIQMTLSRLGVVKQHIQNLYATGKVVGAPLTTIGNGRTVQHPLFWNANTYNMAMQAGADTSYLEHAATRYAQESLKGPQFAEGAPIPQPVLPQPAVNVNNPPQAIANPPLPIAANLPQPVVNVNNPPQAVVNQPQPVVVDQPQVAANPPNVNQPQPVINPQANVNPPPIAAPLRSGRALPPIPTGIQKNASPKAVNPPVNSNINSGNPKPRTIVTGEERRIALEKDRARFLQGSETDDLRDELKRKFAARNQNK
jgi:Domain of unknown function (DUF4157)